MSGTELDARLATLSDTKRALLERLMKAKGEAAGPVPIQVMPRAVRRVIEPATAAQERVFRLCQQNWNDPVANVSFALRLRGKLDRAGFVKSMHELVERHEVLRTVFREEDGRLHQLIRSAAKSRFEVRWEDVQELPPDEQEQCILEWAEQEALQPFDLGEDSLFRVKAVSVDEQEHIWYLTLHHIVFDGWSIGVLLEELAQLYRAFTGGKPSPLPPLVLQFADYAAWQEQWRKSGHRTKVLQEWKQTFRDVPSLGQPDCGYSRSSLEIALDSDLTERIRKYSQEQHSTIYMTLLSAYVVALTRLTGQPEVVIGTPVAGRTHKEFERLIGMFVNIAPMRIQAETKVSGEMLQKVRLLTAQAFARQDLPIDDLLADLADDLPSGEPPLYPYLFVLQNAPASNESFVGLELSVVRRKNVTQVLPVQEFYSTPGAAKVNLSLVLSERASGIAGLVEYNRKVLDESAAQRFAVLFKEVLRSL